MFYIWGYSGEIISCYLGDILRCKMPNVESWSILWGIWNLKRSQSGFSVWLATTLFLFALMKRFYKVISASFLAILAWDNNKWRIWCAGLSIDDPVWWDQVRTTQYYNEFGLSKKPKQMLAQILASNQCQYLKKRCMMLAINHYHYPAGEHIEGC